MGACRTLALGSEVQRLRQSVRHLVFEDETEGLILGVDHGVGCSGLVHEAPEIHNHPLRPPRRPSSGSPSHGWIAVEYKQQASIDGRATGILDARATIFGAKRPKYRLEQRSALVRTCAVARAAPQAQVKWLQGGRIARKVDPTASRLEGTPAAADPEACKSESHSSQVFPPRRSARDGVVSSRPDDQLQQKPVLAPALPDLLPVKRVHPYRLYHGVT